jgi:anaerobic ribonucleoside-triphosphate reductase activating protein
MKGRSLIVHRFLPFSRSNGPGMRAVLWLQGCKLGCPGCYNPETHSFTAGEHISVDNLVNMLTEVESRVEGITISGGEPFHQIPALTDLLVHIRREKPRLSILVFSGFTYPELLRTSGAEKVFQLIDVLIAGRYIQEQHLGAGLLGSANKTVHFFTPRYNSKDLANVPEAEILLEADGSVILSGIHPLNWNPS